MAGSANGAGCAGCAGVAKCYVDRRAAVASSKLLARHMGLASAAGAAGAWRRVRVRVNTGGVREPLRGSAPPPSPSSSAVFSVGETITSFSATRVPVQPLTGADAMSRHERPSADTPPQRNGPVRVLNGPIYHVVLAKTPSSQTTISSTAAEVYGFPIKPGLCTCFNMTTSPRCAAQHVDTLVDIVKSVASFATGKPETDLVVAVNLFTPPPPAEERIAFFLQSVTPPLLFRKFVQNAANALGLECLETGPDPSCPICEAQIAIKCTPIVAAKLAVAGLPVPGNTTLPVFVWAPFAPCGQPPSPPPVQRSRAQPKVSKASQSDPVPPVNMESVPTGTPKKPAGRDQNFRCQQFGHTMGRAMAPISAGFVPGRTSPRSAPTGTPLSLFGAATARETTAPPP